MDTDLTGKPKRFHKTKEIIKKLPAQKPHLEFISALLTIPVLITIILLNLNNLQSKKASSLPTPIISSSPKSKNLPVSPVSQNQISTVPTTVEISATPQPTTDPNLCKKDIGPIDITYPQEEQTVNDNPLCITISYSGEGYCAVVWAYKVNDGPLSDYANNSACFYNLPSGNNTFTLQVKSLVSNSTRTISRHFVYKSNAIQPTPTLSPTPTASGSASLTL